MASSPTTTDLLEQLPSALLISDLSGRMVFVNSAFTSLTGLACDEEPHPWIDDALPPAGRIFLQTHVFPLLHREGRVTEISLKVKGANAQPVAVMVDCRQGEFEGAPSFWWVFTPSPSRAKFEAEIIAARNRAQAVATELAVQKRFLQAITDAAPSLIGYWDQDLCCQFANAAYMKWFIGQPQKVEGQSMQELLGEKGFEARRPYVLQALAGHKQVFELNVIDPAGQWHCMIANYIPDVQPDGSVKGYFALVSDVTSMVEAQSEMRLGAAVFQAAAEAIMVIDEMGCIATINPAFSLITGFSADEAIGRAADFMETLYAQDADDHRFSDSALEPRLGDGEAWCRNRWGAAFVMKRSVSLIRGTSGMPDRTAIVFQDVTELWRQRQLDTHRALHDALTDLPNRALLMERLGQMIHASARSARPIALLFLDLDGFKAVNDTLGHDAGDAVLKLVASRLLSLFRQADTVARLGGDEFVVLLDGPNSRKEVETIAQRIIGVVNEPISYDGQVTHVGTSIGIALAPQDAMTARELLKCADAAMYLAKDAGKNTYRFANLQV